MKKIISKLEKVISFIKKIDSEYIFLLSGIMLTQWLNIIF